MTAINILITLLPYILQVVGFLMTHHGVQNTALAKSGQYSPTQVNLLGPGQTYAGMGLFAVGTGMHAWHAHKAAKGTVPSVSAPPPLPSSSNDPAIQTLTQCEKQITEDLNARKAALDAKAAAEITHLRAIADSRKSGP